MLQPVTTGQPAGPGQKRDSPVVGRPKRRPSRLMGRASRPRSAARPVWKITVPVSTESEDAVSELLFQVAGQHLSVYQDFETHQSVARLYLSARPAKKELQQLAVALQTIRRSGLHL